jgi:hypothetical protein
MTGTSAPLDDDRQAISSFDFPRVIQIPCRHIECTQINIRVPMRLTTELAPKGARSIWSSERFKLPCPYPPSFDLVLTSFAASKETDRPTRACVVRSRVKRIEDLVQVSGIPLPLS